MKLLKVLRLCFVCSAVSFVTAAVLFSPKSMSPTIAPQKSVDVLDQIKAQLQSNCSDCTINTITDLQYNTQTTISLSDQSLLIVAGTITAAIDLAQTVQETNENKIHFKLAAPALIQVKRTSTQHYQAQNNQIISAQTPDNTERKELQALVEAACKFGILDRLYQQSRTVFSAILPDQIQIDVRSPSACKWRDDLAIPSL